MFQNLTKTPLGVKRILLGQRLDGVSLEIKVGFVFEFAKQLYFICVCVFLLTS